MKEYKPTYGIQLLYIWAMLFLICLPMMLLAGLIPEGNTSFWQVILDYASVMALLGVGFAFFALVSGLFLRLSSKESVLITDQWICHQNKTVPLDKIRTVTLYLPEIKKYSSKPHFLTVWADKENNLRIQRPSIGLILALKNGCPSASLYVDEWQHHSFPPAQIEQRYVHLFPNNP